jgi:hypothetical protein
MLDNLYPSSNAPPGEQNRVAQSDTRQDFKQKQLAFLNRIRTSTKQKIEKRKLWDYSAI